MTPATPCRLAQYCNSPGFPDWLAEKNCSLGVTAYQAGRLIPIGRKPNESLRAYEKLAEGCKGLWKDGQSLWASTTHTLCRFENAPRGAKPTASGADGLFVPREGRETGKNDIHEIGLGHPAKFGGASGAGPAFISSAFTCLATISDTASFQAL